MLRGGNPSFTLLKQWPRVGASLTCLHFPASAIGDMSSGTLSQSLVLRLLSRLFDSLTTPISARLCWMLPMYVVFRWSIKSMQTWQRGFVLRSEISTRRLENYIANSRQVRSISWICYLLIDSSFCVYRLLLRGLGSSRCILVINGESLPSPTISAYCRHGISACSHRRGI